MKKTATLIIAVFTASLMFAFTNCSPVNFSQSEQSKKAGIAGEPGDPPDLPEVPPTVTEAIKNCKEAKAQGKLVESDQVIVFDDSKVETGRSQVCLFEQNGNLSMVNSVIRARHEQVRKITVPAGAVICGADMKADAQQTRYDDVFVLTFNDYVLASNLDIAVQNTSKIESLSVGSTLVPVYKYDWPAYIDINFNDADGSHDYCLGKSQGYSTCKWPLTDTNGELKFNFDPELMIAMGVKATSANQRLALAVTGDNDPNSDCAHSRIELKMKLFYYMK